MQEPRRRLCLRRFNDGVSVHSAEGLDDQVDESSAGLIVERLKGNKPSTMMSMLSNMSMGLGGLKQMRSSTSVGQILKLNLAENREELARIARMAVKEKEVSVGDRRVSPLPFRDFVR